MPLQPEQFIHRGGASHGIETVADKGHDRVCPTDLLEHIDIIVIDGEHRGFGSDERLVDRQRRVNQPVEDNKRFLAPGQVTGSQDRHGAQIGGKHGRERDDMRLKQIGKVFLKVREQPEIEARACA